VRDDPPELDDLNETFGVQDDHPGLFYVQSDLATFDVACYDVLGSPAETFCGPIALAAVSDAPNGRVADGVECFLSVILYGLTVGPDVAAGGPIDPAAISAVPVLAETLGTLDWPPPAAPYPGDVGWASPPFPSSLVGILLPSPGAEPVASTQPFLFPVLVWPSSPVLTIRILSFCPGLFCPTGPCSCTTIAVAPSRLSAVAEVQPSLGSWPSCSFEHTAAFVACTKGGCHIAAEGSGS